YIHVLPLDVVGEGPWRELFLARPSSAPAIRQDSARTVGEPTRKAGRAVALPANLQPAFVEAVQHYCNPVKTCSCSAREKVTSSVARAVSRKPPLDASLNGSRIKSIAPHAPTKIGATPPAEVVSS